MKSPSNENMVVGEVNESVLNNCSVKITSAAKIRFSVFACTQFMLGARLCLVHSNTPEEIKLLFKVLKLAPMESEDKTTFFMEEFEILRKWLELRIVDYESGHAEELKSPGFAKDTYISMRLLLLDLREIMSCKVIETAE